MTETNKPQDQKESGLSGFLQHLFELRDRLLKAVLAVLVVFVLTFAFVQDLYNLLAEPLTRHLPEGTSLIATKVVDPFLVPMKLALMLSVFITAPYWLYQMWAFIAPGLYDREKKLTRPLVISSIFLFYAGAAFAYFVVFPLVFGFLTTFVPTSVAVMTDMGDYLNFVMAMFFIFGLAFEVPIATILLVALGTTTPDNLASKRPYVIVGAFVIGMFLTPPDIISQVMMAIPMWLLFEVGIFFSRMLVREREKQAAQEESEREAEPSGTAAAEPKRPEADSMAAAVAAAASSAGVAREADADEEASGEEQGESTDEQRRDAGEEEVEDEDADLDDEFDRIEKEFEDLESDRDRDEDEPEAEDEERKR